MKNSITHLFYLPLLLILTAFAFVGCADEKEEIGLNSGFVQFKLYKSGSEQASTNRSINELEYLKNAQKIEVTLSANEESFKQTLNLQAYSDSHAEYGLTSEKFKMLAGNYTVIGYRLFDALDEVIYEGVESENSLQVVGGGLTIKEFGVSVTPRGKAKFTLVKDFSSFVQNRNSETPTYLFESITAATIKVRNSFTGEESTFEKLPFHYATHAEGSVAEGNVSQSASASADSILTLKAGNYELVSYTVYNKTGNLLELNEKIDPTLEKNCFTVTDNVVTHANVPITMYEAAEHIKDYIALKEIWEALDGPNWFYYEQGSNYGKNWDFKRDVDMWGKQPGVELDSRGRIVSLVIGAFGPSGDVPAALGQLTELNVLALGLHTDMIGPIQDELGRMTPQEVIASRYHYANLFLKKDLRASFSKELVHSFTEFQGLTIGNAEPLFSTPSRSASTRDVTEGGLSNKITSIPEEIGQLKKLTHLYIANGLVSKLPESVSELVSLTDLEIYNCPRMTQYPTPLNTLPRLEALNIARNTQIPHQSMYDGLNGLATKDNGVNNRLQIIYANFNSLEKMPHLFTGLVKIGLLDLSNNKMKEIVPLGSEVRPVQLFLSNNQIKEIPLDANGIFCGIDDLELAYFNDNELTQMPNMFTAQSAYVIDEVDFSYNKISSIEGVADGSYKGIRAKTLNLAKNEFKEFPNAIYNAGSVVPQLNLSGNRIEYFDNDGFYGENLYSLESIDLSNNRLTELPASFNATKVPYFYGIDLSYNMFSRFPYGPLNCPKLTVFIMRSQRDDEGRRTLREWPTGISRCPSLRGFYIGSNDYRKIDDTLSYLIYIFDVSDNPNITLDVSGVCSYIKAGVYQLIYDSTQDIRGCDALNLDN